MDNSPLATLAGLNYSGVIFASPTANVPGSCGAGAVNTPCLTSSMFAPPANGAPTGFGTIGRNSVYGPNFFNVDLAFAEGDPHQGARDSLVGSAGVQSVQTTTNFDQPGERYLAFRCLGRCIATVGPPTSLLGSFVGAGSSPRFLEIKGIVRVLASQLRDVLQLVQTRCFTTRMS
ncbi:MAG: hypothetical protein WDO73_00160 [Ignavibacteriota bacterium]